MKKNQGFILIEMLMYIALFSIMIGGLSITAFDLMSSTDKTNQKVLSQEELNFAIKKVDYLLNSMEDIVYPTFGDTDHLKVTKGGVTYEIRRNATNQTLELCANSCSNSSNFNPITTLNVKVVDFTVSNLPANGNAKEGLKVKIKIDDKTATITKYLKI